MDSVEAIAVAVGGGVMLLVIVAVFVLPGLGGDRRRGDKEHDYASNQPTAGGEGGD